MTLSAGSNEERESVSAAMDRRLDTQWGEMSLGMVLLAVLGGVPAADLRPDAKGPR